MFISSTPQSVRGSPILRSRSNSLPNDYLNNIQPNAAFNKTKSRKKESNGKARRNDTQLIGKQNKSVRTQKHKKNNADETRSSNHISNDSLPIRSMGTSQSSSKRLSSNSRQGERERQKVMAVQDRFGSYVVRGSDSIDIRDSKSNKTVHL